MPPNNLEAERSLLGAMLLRGDAVGIAAAAVRTDDFYKPAHGHIFDAIVDLYGKSEAVDVVTVADRLNRTGLLDAMGGPAVLTDIISDVPSLGNTEQYADIISDLARQRRLIGVAGEIAELGYEPTTDVPAAIDKAEHLVYGLTSIHAVHTSQPLRSALSQWLDDLAAMYENGRARGVETGFYELDNLILGLHAGQLVVVAGRPGMGKTAFGSDVARQAATEGHPTLLVSLEMGTTEVTNRIVSAAAKVPLQNIREAKVADADWTRVSIGVGKLQDLPLEILDDSQASVLTIRSQARRVASRYGRLGLIVVDYLQLVDHSGRHTNREGEVAEVARGLKKLARELGVPVLALAQLNRGLEQRSDKRPMLSDLRESGEIENAADVVCFLYRDDYYVPDSKEKGVAEVIVAKQRSGPTGVARLAWVAQYTTFANMVRTT